MLPPLVTQSLPTGLWSRRSISGSAARTCAEPQTTILTANTTGTSCRARHRMAFPRSWSLFHDDLAVHPWVRGTDVVIATRLVESDHLRLARVQNPGIPAAEFAILEGCRGVRGVAGIGKGHRGPGLDPCAPREIGIFAIVVADFNRILTLGDRSGRSGHGRRRGWGPQRGQLSLQRECPHGVAIGAAHALIAAGGNSNVFVAVDLVDHGSSLGAKTGLELPEQFAGLGITGHDRPTRVAVKDETAGRRRRTAAAADAVRHIFLPNDLVGIAGNCSPVAAHFGADRRRLSAAVILLAFLVGIAVTREGARADRARHVEIPGIRVVRHRGPVGAANPGRLD